MHASIVPQLLPRTFSLVRLINNPPGCALAATHSGQVNLSQGCCAGLEPGLGGPQCARGEWQRCASAVPAVASDATAAASGPPLLSLRTQAGGAHIGCVQGRWLAPRLRRAQRSRPPVCFSPPLPRLLCWPRCTTGCLQGARSQAGPDISLAVPAHYTLQTPCWQGRTAEMF
jgi:hypothetical protein